MKNLKSIIQNAAFAGAMIGGAISYAGNTSDNYKPLQAPKPAVQSYEQEIKPLRAPKIPQTRSLEGFVEREVLPTEEQPYVYDAKNNEVLMYLFPESRNEKLSEKDKKEGLSIEEKGNTSYMVISKDHPDFENTKKDMVEFYKNIEEMEESFNSKKTYQPSFLQKIKNEATAIYLAPKAEELYQNLVIEPRTMRILSGAIPKELKETKNK